MSENSPRITIGIPVFNGESFLAETLDSLLNQTFSDFEIAISDNASTDRTEQICRAYAARDPRIRYYRSDINRGAAWNHNRVFELAHGEFFKWNSADDLCAPEFLARCVAALDQDPSAVMAISLAIEIDERGKPLESVSVPGLTLLPVIPRNAPAHIRFRQTIRIHHLCIAIYSLFRSRILRQTELIGGYTDSDRVLLAQLTLFGHCVIVPELLLFNRDHRGRFTRAYQADFDGWRERNTWFDPSNAGRRQYPHWRKFLKLGNTISRSTLHGRERLLCYGELFQWLLDKANRENLYWEATYYPRGYVVRHFPWAKVVWNWLCAKSTWYGGEKHARQR